MSSTISAIAILAGTWTIYAIYGIVWRLYFSPLARFPGPKLAAVTLLYEMYYEIVAGGQYTFKIRDMHEKYGPIVRINPWELHINDPEYYDEIYAGGSKKREKWPYLCGQFGTPQAAISTVSHDLHRMRRVPMNKLFSKSSITKLEPLIQSTVDDLCTRLRTFERSGEVVIMSLAWTCVTLDIISEYAFGKSYDYVNTAPGFYTDVHEAMVSAAFAGNIIKQVPWMVPLMKKLPDYVMRMLEPKVADLMRFQDHIEDRCRKCVESDSSNEMETQRSIFHEILASDLPPEEKTVDRLRQEGQVLIGAGTETTAWTLSVITFYILNDPIVHAKLKEELDEAFAKANGKPKLNQLEQLPYLSAVISEGLRLSFGVTTHLQRVSPNEDLIYEKWTIPAGTPVSMTSVLLHLNPKNFPKPTTFRPERFIENPRLTKYLVSFSKGSRQCLGINLAFAELYLCVSYVMMAFPNMRLFETTKEDVEIKAEYFVPVASGRGVKVMMG